MIKDGMLSQDEIDALLNGTHSAAAKNESIDEYLSLLEQDALGEIGNISFGSASTALSALLNQKVQITTPTVSIIRKEKLKEEFPVPHVAVQVEYVEGIQGQNLLVIKTSDAQIIADLMLGGDGSNYSEEFGELQLSAVGEAMNQMMGSASTSLSTIFKKRVDISPPTIDFLDVDSPIDVISSEEILIKISFRLKVGTLIDSSIMQLVHINFAQDLVKELMVQSDPVVEVALPTEATVPPVLVSAGRTVEERAEERKQPVDVQPAIFSDFEEASNYQSEVKNLDMLLDIPLQVTVELGRTKKTVKEILELTPGSILELDKLAGEPVDILVNNKLVAKGEVVVIDENFGVRVTEIASKRDRLSNLK